MDRIDAYNEQAKLLLEKYNKGGAEWKEKMDKAMDLGKYIDSKLNVMILPQETPEQLEEMKREGKELQNKYLRYNSYLTTTGNLLARKKLLEDKLVELKAITFPDSPESINSKITEITNKNSWINDKLKELWEIKSKGRTAYMNRQELDKQKKCPSCGQIIQAGAHLEEHKAELDREIQGLLLEQE
jgi:hypothetical protein